MNGTWSAAGKENKKLIGKGVKGGSPARQRQDKSSFRRSTDIVTSAPPPNMDKLVEKYEELKTILNSIRDVKTRSPSLQNDSNRALAHLDDLMNEAQLAIEAGYQEGWNADLKYKKEDAYRKAKAEGGRDMIEKIEKLSAVVGEGHYSKPVMVRRE